MHDPRANIEVQYTDQPIRSLRRYFDLLQIGQAGVPKRQFLIVANSRAKIERTHADVQQYIDSQSHIQGSCNQRNSVLGFFVVWNRGILVLCSLQKFATY